MAPSRFDLRPKILYYKGHMPEICLFYKAGEIYT